MSAPSRPDRRAPPHHCCPNSLTYSSTRARPSTSAMPARLPRGWSCDGADLAGCGDRRMRRAGGVCGVRRAVAAPPPPRRLAAAGQHQPPDAAARVSPGTTPKRDRGVVRCRAARGGLRRRRRGHGTTERAAHAGPPVRSRCAAGLHDLRRSPGHRCPRDRDTAVLRRFRPRIQYRAHRAHVCQSPCRPVDPGLPVRRRGVHRVCPSNQAERRQTVRGASALHGLYPEHRRPARTVHDRVPAGRRLIDTTTVTHLCRT
ncbi:Uncharacterised protein [Mycobacteroides abscessus subsp. abscessus]|nr:Uncharacterised protein [Mycobacteroides abscessus subsp. abscessus]